MNLTMDQLIQLSDDQLRAIEHYRKRKIDLCKHQLKVCKELGVTQKHWKSMLRTWRNMPNWLVQRYVNSDNDYVEIIP